jgi:hypothetical protein
MTVPKTSDVIIGRTRSKLRDTTGDDNTGRLLLGTTLELLSLPACPTAAFSVPDPAPAVAACTEALMAAPHMLVTVVQLMANQQPRHRRWLKYEYNFA